MTDVLHLTHTNVLSDARVRRQVQFLGQEPGIAVNAYGVAEEPGCSESRYYTLRQFRVRSSRLLRIPRSLRYVLVLVEVNARFTLSMLQLRPKIVHCHDTMVLPAGVIAKAFIGAKLIYDAHELESNKAGQNRFLSYATLAIERLSWASIEHLITVSPSIADWYTRNLGPKPTALILNSPAVSRRISRPTSETSGIRKALELEEDVQLLVYVGHLETGRGIELLLQVIADSACCYHIAFVGSGSLSGVVKAVARSNPRVHYCEPRPHEELVSFIQGANGGFCLIEPVSLSDYFCLPNKLFEYAFAGLPVIASDLPDIKQLLHEYEIGVCTELNSKSVDYAIQEVLTRRESMPEGKLRNLSWAAQEHKLRNLYSGLDVGG